MPRQVGPNRPKDKQGKEAIAVSPDAPHPVHQGNDATVRPQGKATPGLDAPSAIDYEKEDLERNSRKPKVSATVVARAPQAVIQERVKVLTTPAQEPGPSGPASSLGGDAGNEKSPTSGSTSKGASLETSVGSGVNTSASPSSDDTYGDLYAETALGNGHAPSPGPSAPEVAGTSSPSVESPASAAASPPVGKFPSSVATAPSSAKSSTSSPSKSPIPLKGSKS